MDNLRSQLNEIQNETQVNNGGWRQRAMQNHRRDLSNENRRLNNPRLYGHTR